MKFRPIKTSLPLHGRRRAALALALSWTALWLAGCDARPPKASFASTDITGADYAQGFALADQDGQTRTLNDFRGKAVAVFFGFTQCPDVCPTTLAEMAEIKRMLGQDGERLQVVFITVDPERDTQAVLKAYMVNFDPTFLALRPTADELKAVSADFKIYVKKVGDSPTAYSMDHSAGTYVFDPAGRIRLYGRYGSSVKVLADDIHQLLAGA